MASNAESSSVSNSSMLVEDEGARPQAGPLPRKRGEIGFSENVDLEGGRGETSGEEETTLPERHPADTQLSPSQSNSSASPSSNDPPPPPDSNAVSSDASSTTKIPKNKLIKYFGKLTIAGITFGSFVRLFIQLALLGGTLAAWIIITQHLLHGSPNFSSTPDTEDDENDDNSGSSLGGSASIFVHVTFALAVLGQLIFLERCVFHMRAQRYAFKHPGAALPTSRSTGRPGMGFAPWNRPSLPTYAAALAQSGLGTGDVEDNLIAIPPPPAYGNTRGSTLLLRGFLRNSLREAIRSDGDSQHRMSVFSQRSSRPVSYHSQDGDAAERSDAQRAMRLAETLQQLEEANCSVSEGSQSHISGDEETHSRRNSTTTSTTSQGQ